MITRYFQQFKCESAPFCNNSECLSNKRISTPTNNNHKNIIYFQFSKTIFFDLFYIWRISFFLFMENNNKININFHFKDLLQFRSFLIVSSSWKLNEVERFFFHFLFSLLEEGWGWVLLEGWISWDSFVAVLIVWDL